MHEENLILIEKVSLIGGVQCEDSQNEMVNE